MGAPSTLDAQTAVSRMAQSPLDVLIIGGGIVGAGVARDAAMRGLHVGLVDRRDFASGTSSRSSRLLHGGLRYLAQGRLGLVYEASAEKRILARIAPHLAEPLAFIFPTFRGDGWPLWKLRIGVKLYDLLCAGRNMGPSSATDAAGVRQLLPGLESRQLTGAVRYFDALTSDARLVLDTLRSAHRHGALLANYTSFLGAEPTADGWRCRLQQGDRDVTVAARCVVNATGPWSDRLAGSSVRLRPTKGVHIVVDRQRLNIPDAVVMTQERRILFAIPWGERVILGTTDTDYHGPVDQVCTEAEDVEYILAIANRTFPEAELTPSDVVACWAGLRPLVADPDGHPSDISRSHQIRSPMPRWIDVTGGKLTTYRRIGLQTVNAIARQLNRTLPPSRTADEPLVPPEEAVNISGVIPPPVSRTTIEHYCFREWAVHLEDIMLRRTGWAYYRADAEAVAEQVAAWMGEILDWDPAQTAEQLASYRGLPIRCPGEAALPTCLAQSTATTA